MNKILRNKLLIFICAFITFTLVGRVVKQTPLLDRIIAIGIGVDVGETKAYKLSVQTVIAGNAIVGEPSSSKVIEAEGDTLLEAVFKISDQEGKGLSMSHCILIILGKEIVEQNMLEGLDFLIRESGVPEMCKVVQAESKAIDIFKVKVPKVAINSNQISRMLSSFDEIKNLRVLNIKDLAIEVNEYEGTVVVPIVNTVPVDPDSLNDSEKPDVDYKDFIIENTTIVNKNGDKLVIGIDVLDGLKIFRDKMSGNVYNYTSLAGDKYGLLLTGKKSKQKYEFDDKPVVKTKVDVVLSVKEIISENKLVKPIYGHNLTNEDIIRIENMLKMELDESIDLVVKQNGLDVFHSVDRFSRLMHSKGLIKSTDIVYDNTVKVKLT